MNTDLEQIINWAYLEAIRQNNLPIIQKCIDAGCKFTFEHISLITKIINDHHTNRKLGNAPIFDTFDLLTTKYFSQFASDTELMFACIRDHRGCYLNTMIIKGYNSNYPNSHTVFLKSLPNLESWNFNMEIMLVCGFDQYFQTSIMDCIENNYTKCIKFFFEHGVSFYSELQSIQSYVADLHSPHIVC